MCFRFLPTIVATLFVNVALGHVSDVAQPFLLDLSFFALCKTEIPVFLANSAAL